MSSERETRDPLLLMDKRRILDALRKTFKAFSENKLLGNGKLEVTWEDNYVYLKIPIKNENIFLFKEVIGGDYETAGRVHICGKAGREAHGEECDLCALFVEYVADCDRKGILP